MSSVRWLGTSPRSRVLGVIAITALPLLLVAALLLWQNAAEAEASVVDERVGLARAAALTADVLLDREIALLQSLAVIPIVRDPARANETTRLLTLASDANPNTSGPWLYGPDGWNIAAPGAEPHTLYLGDRPYFQDVLRTGRPAISPALIGRVTGQPAVFLAVPVDLATGQRGVLLASIALQRLDQQLRALPKEGTVRFVAVDAEGHVFIHPDPAITARLAPLGDRPDVQAVLAGETGDRLVRDERGREWLVAYAPVPRSGWGMLVLQPVDEAFAVIRRQVMITAGAFVIAALLAVVTGWYLGGQLSAAYEAERAARSEAQASALELGRITAISEGRRRFLERIIANAPAGIAVYRGRELCCETVNEQYRAFKPGVEMVGKTLDEVFPEFLEQRVVERLQRVVETGEPFTGIGLPLEIRNPDGSASLHYFTVVCAAYDEPEGKLAGVIVFVVDTTAAVQQRHQVEREKDEFLTTASHELKTPIAALSLAAQMLERMIEQGVADPERLQRYVATVHTQVRRMTRLVGDLLDVSRVHTGRLELTTEAVDLVALATTAIQRQYDALGDSARTEIRLQSSPSPVVIAGDEVRLDQVLTNLLSNAVKYSPDGGPIDVVVGGDASTAWLRVADCGIGVPAGERDRLFTPFARTSAAQATGVEGTGLGLYIARRIVEAHGGTITYEDTPGGGATFVVRLPVSADNSQRLRAIGAV